MVGPVFKADIEEMVGETTVGIKIDNLNQVFGKFHVLKNLSLDLYQNEITALLGGNGAGKTVRALFCKWRQTRVG